MPEDTRNLKIRVKSGESEAEIEGSLSSIREAIELIPEIVAKLPQPSLERRVAYAGSANEVSRSHFEESTQFAPPAPATPVPSTGSTNTMMASASSIPTVTIEKGDSLSDVISKFFADPWGRSPRKLMEVREALQSYGLNYPKQSVAVALLRLAKSSKIRRFKGEGGEYVYTASMGSMRISAPTQSMGGQSGADIPEQDKRVEQAVGTTPQPPVGEGAEQREDAGGGEEEQQQRQAEEEQLNLDAPSPN